MSKNKKNKFFGGTNTEEVRNKENVDNKNEKETRMEDNQPEENAGIEDVTPEIVDNFDAVEDGEETAEPTDTDVEDNDEVVLEKKVETLTEELEKEKKEYLFLMAEFDNFRKRTLKEKSEIIKNAGEKVFKGLLPIVDDMERGIKASQDATDVATVREGLELIYNKLIKFMEANGVKAYDESEDNFDADKHEAITAVPVDDESKKGKILDTIEKGYTINDKVLRHARVVVGR